MAGPFDMKGTECTKWVNAERRMSIMENKTSTFMLSWSRTSQAVKLAPMATIWCKVDGVIFNDISMGRPYCMAACWRFVFVTPESFKICMIFFAGCWVSVGNVWNHFLMVAAEKPPGWYCLSTGEEASKIFDTESNEQSSSPSEIHTGVRRTSSAAAGTEGADASWGGNILDNFCWVVSSVFLAFRLGVLPKCAELGLRLGGGFGELAWLWGWSERPAAANWSCAALSCASKACTRRSAWPSVFCGCKALSFVTTSWINGAMNSTGWSFFDGVGVVGELVWCKWSAMMSMSTAFSRMLFNNWAVNTDSATDLVHTKPTNLPALKGRRLNSWSP